jgi:hypothetical protein
MESGQCPSSKKSCRPTLASRANRRLPPTAIVAQEVIWSRLRDSRAIRPAVGLRRRPREPDRPAAGRHVDSPPAGPAGRLPVGRGHVVLPPRVRHVQGAGGLARLPDARTTVGAEYSRRIEERLSRIRPGDMLDGAPEPLVSVPNTANGRRLEGSVSLRRKKGKAGRGKKGSPLRASPENYLPSPGGRGDYLQTCSQVKLY